MANDDGRKARRFVKGLRTYIRDKLAAFRFEEYTSAVNHALNVEANCVDPKQIKLGDRRGLAKMKGEDVVGVYPKVIIRGRGEITVEVSVVSMANLRLHFVRSAITGTMVYAFQFVQLVTSVTQERVLLVRELVLAVERKAIR